MATLAQPVVVRSRWTAERRFHVGMSVALLATVFVGFARSFFLRPLFPTWPAPHEPVLYAHGAAFTAWFVLLVIQSWLIGAGQVQAHRRLGTAGAFLAMGMLALGFVASLTAARRATGFVGIPVPPLQFLIVPIGDLLIFGTFVGLGVITRRVPQVHKRWMLLASIAMTTAAVARWPGVIGASPLVFFALSDLFLVPMALWDYQSRGRVHPVTLWGGLALVSSQPLRLVLSSSPAWLALAQWLTAVRP
jgi:uncharacterized membrane protein YozB (DUF420 family)